MSPSTDHCIAATILIAVIVIVAIWILYFIACNDTGFYNNNDMLMISIAATIVIVIMAIMGCYFLEMMRNDHPIYREFQCREVDLRSPLHPLHPLSPKPWEFNYSFQDGKLKVDAPGDQSHIEYNLGDDVKLVKSCGQTSVFSDGTVLTNSCINVDNITNLSRRVGIEPKTVIHGNCRYPSIIHVTSDSIDFKIVN